MTFEELLILVDKMNGEAGNATGGNVDSLVYSGLDVHLMLEEIKSGIEQLQETYAPKIKMTKRQKHLVECDLLDLFDIDSDTDWDTGFIDEDSLGIVAVPELSGLAEDDVVNAWLHPELIEVEE